MIRLFAIFTLFILVSNADVLTQERTRGATLVTGINIDSCTTNTFSSSRDHERCEVFEVSKPISACCDIPELGEPKHLSACSNPRPLGPCNDVQCVFESSGFLKDKNTLNKEAYTNHLQRWLENNKGWSVAIDKVISDCVDKDLRQYLDYPCKAYDVFTCTGIAMLKKCPKDAWKC